LIFSRLGLDVDKTFIPHQVALEQMRKGENGMAAVVFVTGKPVDAFVRGRFDPGFKFLPVPYDNKLDDYYLPSRLESTDYPNLIKAGRARRDGRGADGACRLQLASRVGPL